MMDFNMIYLMSNSIRVRETYTRYARRYLVSPTLEDNFASTSSVLNKFSFR